MIELKNFRESKKSREPSGIEVGVLDLSIVSRWAEEELRLNGNNIKLETRGDLGVVKTSIGDFIVHSEGIVDRNPLSDFNPWTVDLYRSSELLTNGARSLSTIPVGVINITPSVLRKMYIKRILPLEKFIRVFGGRLESNYAICKRKLMSVMDATKVGNS